MEGRGGEDRKEWEGVECVRERGREKMVRRGEKRLINITLQICFMKSYHIKIVTKL